MSQVDPIEAFVDPLVDAKAEEAILSTMMTGVRVESLDEHHFTHKVRKAVYVLLRSGVPYKELDANLARLGIRDEGYVTDIFVTPLLPHKSLVEAVAELKRLHLMRRFVGDVEGWLKAAPGLDWPVALRRLGEVIRRQGQLASLELSNRNSGPTSACSPTPR